jgi:hypothetical protein
MSSQDWSTSPGHGMVNKSKIKTRDKRVKDKVKDEPIRWRLDWDPHSS